jgi:hypothetical protein
MAAAAVAAVLLAVASATAGNIDAPVRADGTTALQVAAFQGDIAEAKRLIKAGANVRAVNAYGVNAMQLAADSGNTELIALLLKAGADPNSPNADGETALHLVARAGDVPAAKLLLKAGAKVDPRENFGGQTPLMWAAMGGNTDAITWLVAHGAKVNAADKKGFTPLFFALRSKVASAPMALLDAGADTKAVLPGDGTTIINAALLQGDDLIAEQAPRLLAAAEFAASILGGARSNTDPLLCNGRAGGVLVVQDPVGKLHGQAMDQPPVAGGADRDFVERHRFVKGVHRLSNSKNWC